MTSFKFTQPVSDLIRQRYSCRIYEKKTIPADTTERLSAIVNNLTSGPLGSQLRFKLVTANEDDPKALRGLGTYGLIRNPAGFLIGAVQDDRYCLEDFGYVMEALILHAADMGLGTCWLGGNFTRSSFARRIDAVKSENIPAVVSIGIPAEGKFDLMRTFARGDQRKPWHELFFDRDFNTPLTEHNAGDYKNPLEMLRLAPSASNKQPWRLLKKGSTLHFYLQRDRNYSPEALHFKLFGLADLQRVDMGIAMCHFELAAREQGMQGSWKPETPVNTEFKGKEYITSWIGKP